MTVLQILGYRGDETTEASKFSHFRNKIAKQLTQKMTGTV